MKILVSGENDFKIRIPNRLFFNQFSATVASFFINRKLKKYKIILKGKYLRKFVREFYKYRRKLGRDFEVVNVESKDGHTVRIIL